MRASILTSRTTPRRGSGATLLRLECSIEMTIYNMMEVIRVDLMVIMYTDTTRRSQATLHGDLETGRIGILISSGVEVDSMEIWV